VTGAAEPRPRRTPADRRVERGQVDDVAVVIEAALRFLEPRARSTAEVRRRLTSAGYREELVSATLDRLTDLGVLDDEQFARDWVRSRDRAHPRGERALRTELRAKGIADPTIVIVLAERTEQAATADATDPDEEAARRLLDRKATFLRRSGDPRRIRQRAHTLLVRNGFSSEIAWRLATAASTETKNVDAPED
jgi:regulatory protein